MLKNLSPASRVREKRFQCIRSEEILRDIFSKKLEQYRHRLQLQIERLEGLSPLYKLQQGYSYTVDVENKNVRRISQVKKGDRIEIFVTDGKIMAQVEETSSIQKDENAL